VHRNLDPSLHQFEKAHEYQRAVNAAKLERVFAKPFVCALTHEDGVTCLAKNKRRVNSLLAGAADGEIKLWDIAQRRCLRRLIGHRAAVSGISVTHDGEGAVSCGADCTARLWKVPFAPFETGAVQEDADPVVEFRGKVSRRRPPSRPPPPLRAPRPAAPGAAAGGGVTTTSAVSEVLYP